MISIESVRANSKTREYWKQTKFEYDDIGGNGDKIEINTFQNSKGQYMIISPIYGMTVANSKTDPLGLGKLHAGWVLESQENKWIEMQQELYGELESLHGRDFVAMLRGVFERQECYTRKHITSNYMKFTNM